LRASSSKKEAKKVGCFTFSSFRFVSGMLLLLSSSSFFFFLSFFFYYSHVSKATKVLECLEIFITDSRAKKEGEQKSKLEKLAFCCCFCHEAVFWSLSCESGWRN